MRGPDAAAVRCGPCARGPLPGAEWGEEAVCLDPVENVEIPFHSESLISGVEVTEEGWWPGSRPGSPFGVFSAQRRGAH